LGDHDRRRKNSREAENWNATDQALHLSLLIHSHHPGAVVICSQTSRVADVIPVAGPAPTRKRTIPAVLLVKSIRV
jgi:hypothetical protein